MKARLQKALLRTPSPAAPRTRKTSRRRRAIRDSVARWMDRSRDFVATLPTFRELREEFAGWQPSDLDVLREFRIR